MRSKFRWHGRETKKICHTFVTTEFTSSETSRKEATASKWFTQFEQSNKRISCWNKEISISLAVYCLDKIKIRLNFLQTIHMITLLSFCQKFLVDSQTALFNIQFVEINRFNRNWFEFIRLTFLNRTLFQPFQPDLRPVEKIINQTNRERVFP